MTKRSDGLYTDYIVQKNGKRKYFYGKTIAEVRAKMRDFEDKSVSKLAFRSVAEEWGKAHYPTVRYYTARNYASAVKRANATFGDRDIGDITPLDCERFFVRMRELGLSAQTITIQRVTLNLIFDFAVMHGELTSNPVVSAKVPRGLPSSHREPPTEEQTEIIKTNTDKPLGLFPLLLLYTGLRKSEALALQWRDIDFDNETISITKGLIWIQGAPQISEPKTKTGVRLVPLLPELKEALVKVTPRPQEHFIFGGESPLGRKKYEAMWDKYCKASGLTGLTTHCMRHGFATFLFESETSDKDAQMILGHSSIMTTRDIYTHIRETRRSAVFDKLKKESSKL